MNDHFEKAKHYFLEGLEHFAAGRFEHAEERFLSSLDLVPGRGSTLVNLAATRIRLAKPQEALDTLAGVVALEPDNLEAWFQRGNAFGALRRHEDALACYDKVLALDNRFAMAWYQRGRMLDALKRYDEALRAFDELLTLLPEHAEGWMRRGHMLHALERHEEALTGYEKALAIDPTLAEAWSYRGGILKDRLRLDEAAICFSNAIAHGDDSEFNRYFLASITGGVAPAASPRRYIQTTFDGYAEKFDQHLLHVLNYQAPAVLAENLARTAGRRFAAGLDLGCGTGLCGSRLKPMVDRLDGVDLASRMIEQARLLGVYERLTHADITDYLQTTEQRYDLVASTDVFIYIGDLAPVFRGVHKVLNRDGVFCFSVESADDDKHYELKPSARYAHSQRYIRDLAEQSGFETIEILQQPIREDQGEPVPGLYFYLKKARIET